MSLLLAITPDLQPDVDLKLLLEIAALNPAVIAAGLYLGSRCNEAGKLIIAGFAAGLAGMALIWVAATLRLPFIYDAGRASAGIFVAQTVIGSLWAAAAYQWVRRRT